MPVTYSSSLRRPYYAGHKSSYLDLIPEEITEEELAAFARMDEIPDPGAARASALPNGDVDQMAAAKEQSLKPEMNGRNRNGSGEAVDYLSAGSGNTYGGYTPSTPGLSRTTSSSDIGNFESFGHSDFPPVDRLTMFDILENLALPQRLEKMQNVVHNQAEKVRRQRAKLAARASSSKDVLVDEWRRRVKLAPDEQLDKYRKRMRDAVDRMGKRWRDAKTVTMKEKVSFVTAVLNIFISAYMIGAFPEYFHYWYTIQLMYV
nr:putative membrane protein [Quercus suber]